MAVHQRSNDWESGVKYAEDESSLSTFLKAALVQLARVGLMTVHTCCSPTTRGDLALTQQLADQALVTACYWLVGFPLATQAWWPTTPADWDMAVHAWGAVLLASGVLATAAAGRAHLLGLLAVTAVYAGLVQPVLSRWVVPTRDRGAAVLAHASGGALALAAELALGRRLAGVHELDARWGFPGHSVVAVSTAYLLVAVGSAALGLPVPGNAEPGLNTAALVAGGTALAASSAALVELMVVVVSRAQLDYWALLGVLQAAIAGVVTASSCADLYIPAVWVAVGAMGGLLFSGVSRLVFQSALEDPANLLAIHLVCGLAASLLPPLLSPRCQQGTLVCLGWQLVGALGVTSASLVYAWVAMQLLDRVGLMRCALEKNQHQRALLATWARTQATRGPSPLARIYPSGDHHGKLLPGEDFWQEGRATTTFL